MLANRTVVDFRKIRAMARVRYPPLCRSIVGIGKTLDGIKKVSEHSLIVRDGTQTRELIDETAVRLFGEKGFKETTIRDISLSAKIAEGTLYRHYESKEELAWQLFVRYNSLLSERLDGAQEQQGNTASRLTAIIREFSSFYEANPKAVEFLFLTRHGFMQRLNPRTRNPYLVFRRVIRAGMNSGEIPAMDADVATSMVMGIMLQIIDTGLVTGRIRQKLSDLETVIVNACMRVLSV